MVDRVARRKYAELVRQFVSGRMTNDEYERKFDAICPSKDDQAVFEVYHQVWFVYDDIQVHRMTGKYRLDRAGRRQIAQAVLFLQSDHEYLWPRDGILGCLLFLFLSVSAVATVCVINAFPTWFLPALSASGCFCSAAVTLTLLKSWQDKQQWKKAGDTDAWPFFNLPDLAEAKRRPRLLAGKRR